jgi:soluble lytic murein transglycosylase-like protein
MMKQRFEFRKALGRRQISALAIAAIVGMGAVVTKDGQAPVVVPAAGEQLGYLQQAIAQVQPQVEIVEVERPEIADSDHMFVTRWVARFVNPGGKKDLQVNLARMEPYANMIEEKLEERGMPQELLYLALIESGGNPKAMSPVKARGLWQFMTPTAKQYGLTVNGRVDERINPEKATDAALDYLSDLHKRFGSWYLAAAAYNTGQGRVSRIMKEVTGSSKGTDEDFFRIASRLPKETREYVPKLVAVAKIAKDPAQYGLETSMGE